MDLRTSHPGWRRGCRHWRFRVIVPTVWLLVVLPCSHSRRVHKLDGFMATIATAGLSTLSQITYPAHCSGPTATIPWGFVCPPTSPKYLRSITCPHLIVYSNTILFVDLCLTLPPVDLIPKSLRTHPMMAILAQTYSDDADVNLNTSARVCPNSSEGVDPILTRTHPALLLNCSTCSSQTYRVHV